MEKLTEWIDKQEDYGMCNPPMKAEKALEFLFYYLLGEDFYDPMPENQEQTYTYFVEEVLAKHSRKFRKELKEYNKQRKKRPQNNTKVIADLKKN